MYKQANASKHSKTSFIEVTQRDLSRAVFDALLERDLLGFLLSSKHFYLFLEMMDFEAGEQELALAKNILSAPFKVNAFQNYVLDMYSGIYIEECRHESIEALMLDLDFKAAGMMLAKDGAHASAEVHINQVELAWRYRNQCAKGKPVCF